MTATITKTCPRCNLELDISNFRQKKDLSYYSYCPSCEKLYQKENYEKHKEKYKLTATNRYLENKEEVKKYRKAYYSKNKERCKTQSREINKQRYLRVKDTEEFKSYRRKIANNQLTNPTNRLHNNFRSAIHRSLNNKGGRTWESLVGYTTEELKTHLESQFQAGMSWDNYGKWHIDHITPICSFGRVQAESEEFKTCWSLNNLRPLWAVENIQKGAKDKKLKIRSYTLN